MTATSDRPCKLIAYKRVSTRKQGYSGLGLEGQEAAIAKYVRETGCELVATYTEVESGKLSSRPQLLKALAHARRSKAKLVVAKLDRLSRNVHFLTGLLESSVEFVFCDMPDANRMFVQMMAVLAEWEHRTIGDRVRSSYEARRARGVRIKGTPSNLTPERAALGSEVGVAVLKRRALEAYSDILPMMAQWRSEGMTQQGIADKLNSDGHTTRNGKPWNQVQVKRVLDREVESKAGNTT